jgi:hypothetical protein
MTPADRARVCGRCDKQVHDLSRYTIHEAEALLRQEPDVCVRAHVGGDSLVALKSGRRSDARRMMIAVTATAGLLAASTPAVAKQDRPDGAIAGRVDNYDGFRIRVSATGTGGQTFRTKVKGDGHFKIKHLPNGTYTLTFHPDCGEPWTVENVVVGEGESMVPHVRNANGCIVVGLLRIEDDRG